MKRTTIGIDASKKTLEIAVAGQHKTLKIDNTCGGIRRWLSGLSESARIGIESTGRCHQLLVRLASAAGHTVYLLNPKDLSHYTRSLGRRAKTDRLDAQAIARYLAKEHEELHPYQVPSPLQAELQELTHRRAGFVKTRCGLRQSTREMSFGLKGVKALQRSLDQLIKEIDARMLSLLQQDEQLRERARRLKQVVGFGPLLSCVMAQLLSFRQFSSGDAAVAT